MPTYKYGISGCVELTNDKATKYSDFDILFWLKEHSILTYLWSFKLENIIQYKEAGVVVASNPSNKRKKLCHKFVFERYPSMILPVKTNNAIVQFMLDTTSALSFLHSHDIMHRDLKPENIALTKDKRYVLLDFSHSFQEIIPLQKYDKYVVTPNYRSPEAFDYMFLDDKPTYDSAVDMWSIGMILFELITGNNFITLYNKKMGVSLDEEKTLAELLTKPKSFYKNLKSVYSNRKKPFANKYADVYWGWIKLLLAYNPSNRITAQDMYNMTKKFAVNHQIKHITPSNELVAKPTFNFINEKDLEYSKEIYNLSIKYLRFINNMNNMVFIPNKFICFVKYMISKGTVTYFNYANYMEAVSIIAECVLYDNRNDLVDITRYNQLDDDNVRNALTDIIEKYDSELFSVDRKFSF